MFLRSVRIALGVICASISVTMTAAPKLVPIADTFLNAPASSNPDGFVRLGNVSLFTAADATHGRELWKTDGTPAGTALVTDFVPGTPGLGSTLGPVFGNAVLFTYRGGSSLRLARTDGTAAGTYDLATLTTAFVEPAIRVAGSVAYVVVGDQFSRTSDIWTTDGTPAGTRKAGTYPVAFESASLATNAGQLYFIGNTYSADGRQLWVTDGSTVGTHLVRQYEECPGPTCGMMPSAVMTANGAVYFATAEGLWKTDGTLAGTTLVAARTSLTFVRAAGQFLYFWYYDAPSDTTSPLWWRYDAATGAIAKGAAYRSGTSDALDDGRLVQFRDDGATSSITITDGSAAGTTIVPIPGGRLAILLGRNGKKLFFSANTNFDVELWSYDVDSGVAPALVSDIDPRVDGYGRFSSSSPGAGVALGTKFVFPAAALSGREPWVTDGTAAGTKQLANVAADPGGGAISGTAYDSETSAPVKNVSIVLCSAATKVCDESALTGSDGRYRFDAVMAGSYTLVADTTDVYVGDAYGHCAGCAGGATVPVSVGMESTGVDFPLVRGGIITGRVTRAIDGTAVNVLVDVRDSADVIVDTVRTDAGGNYRTKALSAGSYTLFASTRESAAPVISRWYNGADCLQSCNSGGGQAVAVTLKVVTSGIDFALHGYGSIAGSIRDEVGQPFANVSVMIGSSTFVRTNASGDWTSPPLRPANYTITASAPGYDTTSYRACGVTCDGFATPVAVVADTSTTGIAFALTRLPSSIAGTVRDRNGAAVPGAFVQLLASDGTAARYPNLTQIADNTSADGRYSLTNLRPGTYYLHVASEIHGGGSCAFAPCNVSAGTAITVDANGTPHVDVTLRGLVSTISGRVTDAQTGAPLRDVTIRAADNADGVIFGGTATAADGTYSLAAYSEQASYTVSAFINGYGRRLYANVPENCTSACTPTLVPAGTRSGIDFALVPYGAITGTVRDSATGAPLKVTVTITSASGKTFVAGSDANGRYRWSGPAGSYYVDHAADAYSDPYAAQAYPRRSCGDNLGRCASGTGDLVVIADGADTGGIDFSLTRRQVPAAIRGRVVDGVTGAGVAHVTIGSFELFANAFTDDDGYYSFPPSIVPDGTYHLYANPYPPYIPALYGGKDCPSIATCNVPSATKITVTSGTTTDHVDFRLDRMSITSVSPRRGRLAGGTRVTIEGTNFADIAVVEIGGTAATVLARSATQFVVATPPGTSGYAHVTIRNDGTHWDSLTQAFLYTDKPPRSDFDGDGRSDMLWVNSGSGDTWGWLMNGSQLGRSAQITTIAPGYQVQGIGDFDRDGKSDLVWMGPQGDVWTWLMNGLSIKSSSSPYTVAANYRVAGVGDFDGDGQSDLLWFNAVTGDTYLWLMNGSAIGTSKYLYTAAANYRVAGVGDFDGDGKSDIAWFNAVTGDTYLWLMNGTAIRSSTYVYGAAANYAITGVGDFDGDGKSDLVWFNNVTGDSYIWLMNGASIARSSFIYQVASNFRIAGVGDFDGDGKSDLIWRNTSTGDTYVWLMDGTRFSSSTFIYAPTTQWNVPAPGAF